jgi:hypothetical protein
MDSKPAMSTALIGTAVLVILFTTLVLQVKPIARACQASFSRLRLLIMTNVHVPEIRGRGGGGGGGRPRPRSLSNPSLVQVSHLFIHPGTSMLSRSCSIPVCTVRTCCHARQKLVVVFCDDSYRSMLLCMSTRLDLDSTRLGLDLDSTRLDSTRTPHQCYSTQLTRLTCHYSLYLTRRLSYLYLLSFSQIVARRLHSHRRRR